MKNKWHHVTHRSRMHNLNLVSIIFAKIFYPYQFRTTVNENMCTKKQDKGYEQLTTAQLDEKIRSMTERHMLEMQDLLA